MVLLYFFLLLLLIGFSTFLIQKIKRDIRLKRRAWDFGDNNAVVYMIIAIILAYFSVNFFVNDPEFDSEQSKIIYGTETAQPWLVSGAYRELLKDDSLNADLMFGLIDAHFDQRQSMGPDYRAYNHEEMFIHRYCEGFVERKSTAQSDFGNLFSGIYYFYKGDMLNAENYLTQVKNMELKYLNNFLGRVNYYNHRREEGLTMIKKEISLNGYKEGAWENLALLYNFENSNNNLFLLTYNPQSKEYVPYQIRSGVYIRNGDLRSYFLDLKNEIFKNSTVVGIIGAILILIAWLIYILKVNIQRTSGITAALGTFLLSAILMIPVWLLYDYFDFGMGFKLNGEVWNDLVYCIFGIGFIEELTKILPFLLILGLTKRMKEPIDYIMFASLSALGFAFIENILYFSNENLNIVHTRSLTATISHIINTSIIAYGLILAKFRYRKNPVVFFIVFFLLAMVSHGFYDFWLLNDVVSDYWIVTFIYLLAAILIYASMINNALNNALGENPNIQLNTARLSSNLAAWLIGILLFEFITLTVIYGPTISNRELVTSMFGGGYLILFLSVRLSNIDVFPGEWYPIDWFVGFTPYNIIFGDKRPNYNLGLGKKVLIQNFRTNSKLQKLLPAHGEIIQRIKVRSSTAWYLVKLDPPIQFYDYDNNYVLIRSKNPVDLLRNDEDAVYHFASIPDINILKGPDKTDKSIVFLDWVKAREQNRI